jgi:hypothetical protein
MSDVARIHPDVPVLEMPVQETLPRADGSRIVWEEPRRLLFRRIVRRDGTIVDFRRGRMSESIRLALSEAGHPTDCAEELADRVVIFLANQFEDRLLTTADVAMAVETVLLRSGLAGPARAYAAARGQKPPRVDGSDGSRWLWDRVRIVAALHRETGLDLSLAEEIAREVEHTIIRARLDSVTAPLVRELVNARLLERGLEETRRRHARLGLPVHDVLEKVAGWVPGSDLGHEIGQEVLAQLAMWQMFPAEVVDLYREHLLYVHDTGAIHLPRSRRVSLAELMDGDTSPPVVAKKILAHRSRVGHHLTLVCTPSSEERMCDPNWLADLLRVLSFAPAPVITELEIPARKRNARAVSAILEAAADVAGECGSLASIIQIVLRVSDPTDLPLAGVRSCWSEGIVCIEMETRGEGQREAEVPEIRSKFSLDLARLCGLFEGDVERLIPELDRILRLIVTCAGAPMRAVNAVRRAGQSLLWAEPIESVPLQIGLFGVESAGQWLGPVGWRRLAESFVALRAWRPTGGGQVQLADAPGASVRSWFGASQVQSAPPASIADTISLFEATSDWEPWADLGPVYRFKTVSERRLTRALLSDMLHLGHSWRWGYMARPAWCSLCGRPIAPDAGVCSACPGSEAYAGMRVGWFVRRTPEGRRSDRGVNSFAPGEEGWSNWFRVI